MMLSFRWLNAFGLAVVIAVNYLADRIPIGGKTTGEIAAEYPVLIQPAPYAFGIWLVIYALLTGFILYSFTPQGRESRAVASVNPYFLYSCFFNVAWIFAWHALKITSSVIIIFALLASIAAIYSRVRSKSAPPPSKADRLWVRLPFSVYLGWICVASIVNVAVALYAAGWESYGLSAETWTLIMLTITVLLALGIGLRYRDSFVMAIFVWAIIAIGVANQATHYGISVYCYICAMLLLAAIAAVVARSRHW